MRDREAINMVHRHISTVFDPADPEDLGWFLVQSLAQTEGTTPTIVTSDFERPSAVWLEYDKRRKALWN